MIASAVASPRTLVAALRDIDRHGAIVVAAHAHQARRVLVGREELDALVLSRRNAKLLIRVAPEQRLQAALERLTHKHVGRLRERLGGRRTIHVLHTCSRCRRDIRTKDETDSATRAETGWDEKDIGKFEASFEIKNQSQRKIAACIEKWRAGTHRESSFVS